MDKPLADASAEMAVDKDVPIAVRDGAILRANVFRPARPGRYPVIMSMGIYGKDVHFADAYKPQWEALKRLQPAIDAGSTTIHLILNEPKIEQRQQGEAPNALETLNRSIAVALAATLEKDLETRRRMNASNGANRVVVHQYRPKTLLGGNTGLLNFARENIRSFIAAGERDASQHDCASSECIV